MQSQYIEIIKVFTLSYDWIRLLKYNVRWIQLKNWDIIFNVSFFSSLIWNLLKCSCYLLDKKKTGEFSFHFYFISERSPLLELFLLLGWVQSSQPPSWYKTYQSNNKSNSNCSLSKLWKVSKMSRFTHLLGMSVFGWGGYHNTHTAVVLPATNAVSVPVSFRQRG